MKSKKSHSKSSSSRKNRKIEKGRMKDQVGRHEYLGEGSILIKDYPFAK